jgi:hypothetical protein
MSRPAACSFASSPSAHNPSTQAAHREISSPNVSAALRPNYITADRLYEINRAMTERDWLTLQFVATSRLATGRQLGRRLWSAPSGGDSAQARAARRALLRLSRARVLEPLPRRVGGLRAGSAGMIYSVGVAGAKLLARQGSPVRRLDAPGALYVAHTLAITELVVALHEADRAGQLELLEAQTEPACWRTFTGLGMARLTLKPDLFARVGAGQASEDRWMIEVDLATESSITLRAKIDRHLAYWRSGSESIHPRVLWSAPDERRATQIADVLHRVPEEERRLFSLSLASEVAGFLAREARS